MPKSFTKSKNGQAISKSNKYYGGGNPFSGYAPTCTWYAYGRYYEVKGGSIPSCGTSGINGNGGAFYGFAKAQGKRKTGKTPKVGAIICWSRSGSYSGQGTAGHVAFVEDVKSNGTITISENYSALGYKRSVYDLKPDSNGRYKYYGSYSTFQGFIYQDDNYASGAAHDKSWYIKKYGTGAEVYFELQGYGYSHKACCAVLGNMQQESGIRVKTNGSFDGNGSEGLCQWTFGRKTKMQKYAKEHSKSKRWDSVDGQVAYLVYELKNSEKSANKVLKDESLSLKEMTEQFEKKFERAGIPNMSARVKYAKTWDERMSGAGDGEGFVDEYVQAVVNMQERSSQLYSSNNYKWLEEAEAQESEEQKALKAKQQSTKDFLKNIKIDDTHSTVAVFDSYISMPSTSSTRGRLIKNTNSVFPISAAMVEAPFVEIDFNGRTIGTYKNSVDEFPNHISSLEVDKINGEINKYTFNLVHQIRPGEDPNLIDKLLSSVRYDKIGIKYGDYNSNVVYGDEKAIITNVSMNRDYVSNKISYTIYATSANELVTSHKVNFTASVDKPSNVINSILYDIPETSKLLLDAFPGMRNRDLVYSKNLIPTNDAVLDIESKTNINSVEYLNYLVSLMSNSANATTDVIRKSTYYISYENDFDNSMGGSYFNIRELSNTALNEYNTNNIFEVTVGYPDNNYVMGFNVDNQLAWSLLYENASVSDEYIYSIDNSGNKIKNYSPNLISSSSILNEIQKNWWTQMTHFPINASLTLKGLMKPVMLMDYILVNVVFYGQKHITSGVYVITGQKDTLSGEGFRTTLALTRVGAN